MRPEHRTKRVRPVVSVCALVWAVAVGSCSSGDDEPSTDVVDEGVQVTVTVPPERLTPFCQAMIDLSDELESDQPSDPKAVIVETYVRILDVVPAEIHGDFVAVLAALQGSPPPTTIAGPPDTTTTGDVVEFDEEGYLPDDEPSQRLNDYIQFACRGSTNNPGPPATEPLGGTG
jgi:hypothetical protein